MIFSVCRNCFWFGRDPTLLTWLHESRKVTTCPKSETTWFVMVCSSMANVGNVPPNGWTNHDWFVHPRRTLGTFPQMDERTMTGLFIHGERWERSPKWMIMVCSSTANVGNVPRNGWLWFFIHGERWERSLKWMIGSWSAGNVPKMDVFWLVSIGNVGKVLSKCISLYSQHFNQHSDSFHCNLLTQGTFPLQPLSRPTGWIPKIEMCMIIGSLTYRSSVTISVTYQANLVTKGTYVTMIETSQLNSDHWELGEQLLTGPEVG